jgi:hypothetical protein
MSRGRHPAIPRRVRLLSWLKPQLHVKVGELDDGVHMRVWVTTYKVHRGRVVQVRTWAKALARELIG